MGEWDRRGRKTGEARAQVKSFWVRQWPSWKTLLGRKDCGVGSLDIGFNNLPSARAGGAEDAHGAGPGR